MVAHSFDQTSQTFYSQADVFQVNVPGVDGDFGILANHVPLLTVLRPGVVSVTEAAGASPKGYFGMEMGI